MEPLAILILVSTAIGSIAGNIIASNVYDGAPSLARFILRRAVQRLRIDLRAQYYSAWLADLKEFSGKIDQVRFAVGCYWAVSGLNRIPTPNSYVLRPSTLTFPNRELLPENMRSLPPRTLQGLLQYLYGSDFKGIQDRDIASLAGTRLIHYNLSTFETARSLEDFLALISSRLRSPKEGGRSFALGALASLLRPSLNLPFDCAFIDQLEQAAAFAVRRRTYLNPEFGLLIAGSLSERFPERASSRLLLSDLVGEVIQDPQNKQVRSIAHRFNLWLPRRKSIPLEGIFDCAWLERQVVRPLDRTSPIFSQPSQAERAAARVAEHGLTGASVEELHLSDEMVRLKASDLLQRLS